MLPDNFPQSFTKGVTAQSTDNHFPEQLSFPPRHLYAMSSYRIGQVVSGVSRVANTFMRAPGESIGTFAVESAIDALSYELKMDPIELRMRNEPENDPVSGHPFLQPLFARGISSGPRNSGGGSVPAAIRSQRQGDWLIGQGVATGTYPVYRMVTAARGRIQADGSVLSANLVPGNGNGNLHGSNPACRRALGPSYMEKIRFEYGDSSLPWAGVAGGSSQTISVALAVDEVFDQLLKELLKLAQKDPDSPLFGAKWDDVQPANEGIFRKDHPEVGMSYAAVLKRRKGRITSKQSIRPARRWRP